MKLFIGVGIDRYNTGITQLCGPANDARYLGMTFEQMGFVVIILTDEDLRAGRSVTSTLEEQVRGLGEGDLLVFFFAGHGKTVTSPQPDQLLLLHDVTRRSLDAGFTNNTLSLRQIALETSQPGLQRVLMIDACRMPIEQEKSDSRDGGDAVQFAGEAVFRDVVRRAPRKAELHDHLSPIAVLNSCSDGERAIEIKSQRRGLYAWALQKVMQETRERGKPVVLDREFDGEVERAMDILAAAHQLDRGQQKPVRQGEDVRLYGLEDSRDNDIRLLLARFEEQLAREAFDAPWNDNCRDTLAMLVAKGLPFEEQQALRQRLQAAVEGREAGRREQEWSTHTEAFEGQLAAGRLDAPFDDNCGDTLRHLRQLHLPEAQLNGLRARLQAALDARQRETDRAYDENLIALARQTPSKTLYLNYLNQARLHEHDQEARDFLAAADLGDEESRLWAAAEARPGVAAWQAYLDRFPHGVHAGEARQNLARQAQADQAAAQAAREAKRREEMQTRAKLAAWQDWQTACVQDDESAYAAFLAKHPDGDQRAEAESRLRARREARLKQEQEEARLREDHAAWAKARETSGKSEKCRRAVEAYLAAWPQGVHGAEARALLATLQKALADTPPPSPLNWKKPVLAAAVAVALGGVAYRLSHTPTPADEPVAVPKPITAAPAAPPALAAKPEPTPEQAWLKQTAAIEGGKWWTAGGAMGAAEEQWVKATIAHAEADKWPKAQLEVAVMHCAGIAKPLISRDTLACGQWLSAALTNPALAGGKERSEIEADVSRLFDKRVAPKNGGVDVVFAQAIVPGLAALAPDYPGSAVRLAYVQACYREPLDWAAAKTTLTGVLQHFADQPEAANARKMLADLDAGKTGWCRK